MNIPWTLGAFELGVLFATVLYGIVIAQAFTYTQGKFMDPIWLKTLVGFVCFLDTVHTFAMWSLLYYWSINNFGDPAGLLNIKWMFILAFAFSPAIGALVQSFFAYRMYLLLSWPVVPVIIWSGAVVRIGFAIFRIVGFVRSKTIPEVVRRYNWVLTTTLSINVVLDVLNTVGLLFCLLKNRPVLMRSRKMVDKLLRYTVEIGSITSAWAVITLGLVHYRAHRNFVFLALFAIYPKLFTNSLLASLNARAKFRQTPVMMSEVCIEPGNITTDDNVLDTARADCSKRASFNTSYNRSSDSSRSAC